VKTFGTLKTDIADWLNREDAGFIARVPDFIALAENRIYRDPRSRVAHAEFSQVYLAADDPFNPITLPANFRELLSVVVGDTVVERISDQEFFARSKISGYRETDKPKFCAIIERDLYIFPWPDATKTVQEWGDASITVRYYGTESLNNLDSWNTATNPVDDPPVEATYTPVAQSDNNTTRLLRMAPDVLLYGSLVEACVFLQDKQWLEYHESRFQDAMNALLREHRRQAIAGSTNRVSSVGGDSTRLYQE